ncbi:hypothetical protein GNIT_2945 [Glaciecola nitratireducens FR1064]|uniref:Uncharacterized protein n=1 Tax=Glaciecola nitratireducens (strain JCM 12485 / KCTC 12276 / FR1064) TaxID=1085623 RepID=G4QMV9_GLANF|nr:hypothetical protein GNIT_2945 [Glaciecola nitratireducens FR1064]
MPDKKSKTLHFNCGVLHSAVPSAPLVSVSHIKVISLADPYLTAC